MKEASAGLERRDCIDAIVMTDTKNALIQTRSHVLGVPYTLKRAATNIDKGKSETTCE
jgi:hypothetical protein